MKMIKYFLKNNCTTTGLLSSEEVQQRKTGGSLITQISVVLDHGMSADVRGMNIDAAIRLCDTDEAEGYVSKIILQCHPDCDTQELIHISNTIEERIAEKVGEKVKYIFWHNKTILDAELPQMSIEYDLKSRSVTCTNQALSASDNKNPFETMEFNFSIILKTIQSISPLPSKTLSNINWGVSDDVYASIPDCYKLPEEVSMRTLRSLLTDLQQPANLELWKARNLFRDQRQFILTGISSTIEAFLSIKSDNSLDAWWSAMKSHIGHDLDQLIYLNAFLVYLNYNLVPGNILVWLQKRIKTYLSQLVEQGYLPFNRLSTQQQFHQFADYIKTATPDTLEKLLIFCDLTGSAQVSHAALIQLEFAITCKLTSSKYETIYQNHSLECTKNAVEYGRIPCLNVLTSNQIISYLNARQYPLQLLTDFLKEISQLNLKTCDYFERHAYAKSARSCYERFLSNHFVKIHAYVTNQFYAKHVIRKDNHGLHSRPNHTDDFSIVCRSLPSAPTEAIIQLIQLLMLRFHKPDSFEILSSLFLFEYFLRGDMMLHDQMQDIMQFLLRDCQRTLLLGYLKRRQVTQAELAHLNVAEAAYGYSNFLDQPTVVMMQGILENNVIQSHIETYSKTTLSACLEKHYDGDVNKVIERCYDAIHENMPSDLEIVATFPRFFPEHSPLDKSDVPKLLLEDLSRMNTENDLQALARDPIVAEHLLVLLNCYQHGVRAGVDDKTYDELHIQVINLLNKYARLSSIEIINAQNTKLLEMRVKSLESEISELKKNGHRLSDSQEPAAKRIAMTH